MTVMVFVASLLYLTALVPCFESFATKGESGGRASWIVVVPMAIAVAIAAHHFWAGFALLLVTWPLSFRAKRLSDAVKARDEREEQAQRDEARRRFRVQFDAHFAVVASDERVRGLISLYGEDAVRSDFYEVAYAHGDRYRQRVIRDVLEGSIQ